MPLWLVWWGKFQLLSVSTEVLIWIYRFLIVFDCLLQFDIFCNLVKDFKSAFISLVNWVYCWGVVAVKDNYSVCAILWHEPCLRFLIWLIRCFFNLNRVQNLNYLVTFKRSSSWSFKYLLIDFVLHQLRILKLLHPTFMLRTYISKFLLWVYQHILLYFFQIDQSNYFHYFFVLI